MLYIAITNITNFLEVILLLNVESNKVNPRNIILNVLRASNISIHDIFLLSNFILESTLNVSVKTYEDLNFNEFALLATCSTDMKIMAPYTKIKMDSDMNISENDLLRIAHLISENTDYPIKDILNDYENKVELDAEQIVIKGIVEESMGTQTCLKINSTWMVNDPDEQQDTQDSIGPIIPPDPQFN